jgi:AraC-like DNA-binding protein
LAQCCNAVFIEADVHSLAGLTFDFILIDARALGKTVAAELIQHLRTAFPQPVIVYAGTRSSSASLANCFAGAAEAVLFRNLDDHPRFGFDWLISAVALHVANDVCSEIDDRWLHTAVIAAAATAGAQQTVDLFVQRLALNRKAVHAALRSKGLWNPKNLIQWIRLLVAAFILSRGWRLIRDLSRDLGWADDEGLEMAAQQRLGLTPRDLRTAEAFDVVRTAFLKTVRPKRDPFRRDR